MASAIQFDNTFWAMRRARDIKAETQDSLRTNYLKFEKGWLRSGAGPRRSMAGWRPDCLIAARKLRCAANHRTSTQSFAGSLNACTRKLLYFGLAAQEFP